MDNYIRRDLEEKIIAASKEYSCILITGARQVGKSYIIRETLKENKVDFVEFNFIDQKNNLEIFKYAVNQDSEKFLSVLRVASNRVLKENTVIFFDEIQECKDLY